MGTDQFDRAKMINAIWAAKGKVSIAANAVGCDPNTIFNYAKKYATVQQAIDEARAMWDEQLLDLAEVKLYEEVKNSRAWAIKYALATKGKDRGYVERQEFAGAEGGPVKLIVEYADDNIPGNASATP